MRDSATAPRPVPGFVAAVLVAAVIAFGVVAIPVFLLRPKAAQQPAVRAVTVIPGPVGTVPALSAGARGALVDDLSRFLKTLYEAAFLSPSASATPAPSLLRLAPLFTGTANTALQTHGDLFSSGDGVIVEHGRVRFDGVLTLNGPQSVSGLLRIDFAARGSAGRTPVDLVEKGNLLVVQSPGGWQVGGFDLKLNTVTATTTPSRTP